MFSVENSSNAAATSSVFSRQPADSKTFASRESRRSLFLWGSIFCFLISSQFAPCQSTEDHVARHFRAGQQAMLQGEFAHARQEFQKVLALDPNLVEAEVNLGLADQSLSDYPAAVEHLTKALRERGNLLAPNVIVGTDYLKLGQPQKALPFLQRALTLERSNREAREALASYYLEAQNFLAAADQFQQMATLDTDKSEAWFKLGHEYLDLAARLAYRGAHLYPDSAWGHRFLGDLLFERNRWDDAANEYHKALAIDPKESGLHSALGQAYLHAGKIREAEAEFHHELEVDSSTEMAWLGLADADLKQGQGTAALEDVANAWKISPEFLALQREFPTMEVSRESAKASATEIAASADGPAKHFLLATLDPIAGENTLADDQWRALQNDLATWRKSHVGAQGQNACRSHRESDCVRWLERKRGLNDSERLLLGEAQFALRSYRSAADALAEVRGVSKENAEASYWLSRTYQALGADAYAQLEESFPDSWRTHQLKAEGYELHQDLDSAVKELELALEIQPKSPELHEALGNLYIEKHSDADAEQELQNALALDSARPRALYLIGRLYVQAGDNEKAIPCLERALRVQPDLSEASSLLGTTYVRLGQFKNAIPPLEKAAQFDHYGNVHYQLYVAYRKLGHMQLAQNALARSEDLRRHSLEHDQAMIMGSAEGDSDPQ